MMFERHISIRVERDIVLARQSAREAASSLGFGRIDQSRIATAVSELTRNVIRYATNNSGDVVIRGLEDQRGIGLEIVVSDEGPGISDTFQVMQDSYASGRGLGLGLPGTKRLMDEMILESMPGSGTTITIRKWRR